MKRVVVGLSGGVDSSVAAYLLKEQGYEVIGMFMRNWHNDEVILSNECCWVEDSNDALLVADKLGIPYYVIDLSAEYKTRIVDYMFAEYEKGRTPNPDVLCNREIKFDVFLEAAMKLDADFVATGHYCRKTTDANGRHHLLAGKDGNKDQSYFLCQLNQDQLAKALFPIGDLLKSEVREIARREGLVTAEKKDSQGLCFIGKVDLPTFLQQQLQPRKGDIIEIPQELERLVQYHEIPVSPENIEALSSPFTFEATEGIKVGEHRGAHYYTIGQRKGLHIGGRPYPSFVLQTDTRHNIVFSGQQSDHPGLNRYALKIEADEIHWVNPDYELSPDSSIEMEVRIRYRQPLQKATLIRKPDALYILFEEMQKGIAPGQFAAWYLGEELIGSGVIA
ncbi:MAG TPA: tRNA 2-thiouridine(34) synthase MnmA [Saprospiraceae bacterium]|nr:MAG: tRNA-specific 2-thiouridylase MnmA [Candidatus Parvibacillus calidus]MBX2938186.1 tRNA 2-thiouridine(34) synthase MnmA [Saprospiraceae bacterium]MBK7740010.1 tRNA 2-thiouridine(34) synthase MnmA [Candidatus Parvibacillus calidus]MBX7179286.1 tRNA 2-thiouridine(34) synthase MnmA [Saprospiraceae bacterium]MCB0590930.1 tRNA 2-thiouridine(34) synthase MnmA [Saprospiraceae bacterium]